MSEDDQAKNGPPPPPVDDDDKTLLRPRVASEKDDDKTLFQPQRSVPDVPKPPSTPMEEIAPLPTPRTASTLADRAAVIPTGPPSTTTM